MVVLADQLDDWVEAVTSVVVEDGAGVVVIAAWVEVFACDVTVSKSFGKFSSPGMYLLTYGLSIIRGLHVGCDYTYCTNRKLLEYRRNLKRNVNCCRTLCSKGT